MPVGRSTGPRALALLALAALCGCAAPSYQDAVDRSAIFDPGHVHALTTIGPEEQNVEMVSWTSRDASDTYYPIDHPPVLGRDSWVTKSPELARLCAAFPKDKAALTLRLQQALGLPQKPENRVFVVLRARRADVVRPCPDPDPAKPVCGPDFPPGATLDYKAWLAEQVLARYRTANGYPWTRLGYTYDWAPGSSGIGPSEFVIRKGATVTVVSKVETTAYCGG